MRELVQGLTAKMGINGLGRALGINGSSVLAWVRGESLPSADLIPRLARLAAIDVDDVAALLIRAQEERAARKRLRPSLGTAAPAAVPSPKRGRSRRGTRLGLLLLVASATHLTQAPRIEAARPITSIQDEGFCRHARRRAA